LGLSPRKHIKHDEVSQGRAYRVNVEEPAPVSGRGHFLCPAARGRAASGKGRKAGDRHGEPSWKGHPHNAKNIAYLQNAAVFKQIHSFGKNSELLHRESGSRAASSSGKTRQKKGISQGAGPRSRAVPRITVSGPEKEQVVRTGVCRLRQIQTGKDNLPVNRKRG
jgi:hypothetical protein